MSSAHNASTIFTIGHSTHSIETFMDMLKANDIDTLVDIRTIPRSKHNPQFGDVALAKSLASEHIDYRHMKDLGGLRHARKDSQNTGWRNTSFRGYADYMQTDAFKNALAELIALSHKHRVAIMCAEALPWRCHRSLVTDALLTRHIPVQHIMSEKNSTPAKLTPFAQVQGENITYPPAFPTLPGL